MNKNKRHLLFEAWAYCDWAEKGIWNWVLKNPILFEKPIENVKGKLGFWEFYFHKIK